MSLDTKLQPYIRSPQPALDESQMQYLQQELRKLERTLQSILQALKELDQRTTP
jgi:prefoldin subunit 5